MAPGVGNAFQCQIGNCFQNQKFLQERAAGSLSLPNLDSLLYFIEISRNEADALFKREGVK